MPALPNVPNVIRLALSGTIADAGPWLSAFFLHYSGTAPTATQLGTFNASVASAYTTDLKALADVDTTLTQIESTDLTSATGAVAITPESIAGTRALPILSAAACTVISYEIARRYRGGHPRGYWKFGVEGDIFGPGQWSSTYVNTVTTDFNAFLTAIFGAGWSGAGTITQVNVSYYSGFTVVTSPTTGRARNVPKVRTSPLVDTVTGITVRQSIGTQRRRVAFVG